MIRELLKIIEIKLKLTGLFFKQPLSVHASFPSLNCVILRMNFNISKAVFYPTFFPILFNLRFSSKGSLILGPTLG